MSDDRITQTLHDIAGQFRSQLRSPILSTPEDAGLDFEDVTFPSEDGVPLEAWFIPKEGSNKLIIVNHPKGFSRYGLPSHLEPWKSMFASSGIDFEVDFIPDYKTLHDAGYNVRTYNLRNFGQGGRCAGRAVDLQRRDRVPADPARPMRSLDQHERTANLGKAK